MSETLEQFAAACHSAMQADTGPRGRNQIRALLENVLKDQDFVARHVSEDGPERNVLYQDPDYGFLIVAHVYRKGREGRPHDHGPSWAIYGQASGETEMSDWMRVEEAAEGKSGKARYARSYTLRPGMAHLYNEGDLHSLKQSGPARLVRIEGTDLEKVRRFGYTAV
jgi:predicted metal-dependent enzyme (double-stranded beta helix superfamily)